MPVSRTLNNKRCTAQNPLRFDVHDFYRQADFPLLVVNFTALPTRLVSTCPRRKGSPTTLRCVPLRRCTENSSPFVKHDRQTDPDVIQNTVQFKRRTFEFHPTRFDFRKVQNVINDAKQIAGGRVDLAEIIFCRGSTRTQGEICKADNGVHGGNESHGSYWPGIHFLPLLRPQLLPDLVAPSLFHPLADVDQRSFDIGGITLSS